MRTRFVLVCLAALAVAATSCGGDGGDGGEAATGSSMVDATAVAEALDCADSFQETDAEPMMGPVPDSAGYCDAEGGVTIEVYGAADDVEGIVTEFPTTGCAVLKGFGIEQFTAVAGENWMVSVEGDTEGTASEQVASTLDGTVHEFDCT